MKGYIGLYTGDSCRPIIKESLRLLEGKIDVFIIDMAFDDEYLSLADELKAVGYTVKLDALDKLDFESISSRISAICIQAELDAINNEEEKARFYLEVGGLDHIMSGAMYTAAYNTGNTVIYVREDGIVQKIQYEPVPEVKLVRYVPGKILDTLYEEGSLDAITLSRKVYADRIVNMNDEQVRNFFNRNHNTYKAIEKIRDMGWIKLNKKSRKYELTEKGNLARVMINLRDERKRMKGS